MKTSPGPIIQFKGINKTYDGAVNILKGLHLDIDRGEFVTLLGPSGSGKTTLLMILAGFEVPTGGEVLLDGQILNHVPAYKRDMGVVFQNYALFPHMTVRKNVGYPLVQRGVSKEEIAKRVDGALSMIHMSEFSERLPAQLSGGQQQRVALARALVYRPQVVLMDEPLGALDKKLREHMQIEIKHLHGSLGMTVVYVTHDQSEALTMSDRIAVFKDGVILQIGSPHEIYEQPNCSFVANFIGETNNFSGSVRSTNGNHCDVELHCGGLVRGVNVCGAGVGDEVNLAVRPERIQIDRTDDCSLGSVRAVVEGTIYHGDHLRYELGIAGTEGAMAKAAIESSESLARGTEVNVRWSEQHGRVLDRILLSGDRPDPEMSHQ
ncbi:ABC transporter ATP-binding protein [Pelagibius sp.]|uniref:ABC transporter ATP-binding protein n=1 Tax=Pelagibius sp. TaxID=1931238 RepID=UPI003BB15178